METKRDIRKMMTALRAAMSEKERAEAGRIIAARLFSSKVYEDAGTVCCYASFGSEVPTEEIIEESLRRGKCAAVPKVTGKQKMKFALIHSMADLKAGFQITQLPSVPLPLPLPAFPSCRYHCALGQPPARNVPTYPLYSTLPHTVQ